MVETNIFDSLMDSLIHIENKSQSECNILICGDLNAHTKVKPDFVVDDNTVHMSVHPDEYIADVELQRFSDDKTT